MDTIGNVISLANVPATPEKVANEIIKALFGNGLRTEHRTVALKVIGTALTAWRETLLRDKSAELEKAKREAHDQMMRADEALLQLASMKAERGEKF